MTDLFRFCAISPYLCLSHFNRMKKRMSMRVSILVLEDCTPMAPIAAMEILNKAGMIHQEITRSPRPFFQTELVSVKSRQVKASSQLNLHCHIALKDLVQTDLLLIPAMEFDVEEKLARNGMALPHLKRLYEKGAELGSLCTGAFLLAATGLLNHKSATTHWYAAPVFRTLFPEVRLEDHKIIVDEGGLYTSGGAASSMHLGMYITEKYCGKETANQAARMLLLDGNESLQTRYSMFIPQMKHTDERILKAQKLIEEGQEEKQTVESMAAAIHMSKRSFIRRFKAATGNTPIEYIQRMNVEKAKRQLEKSKQSVEEIIYSLGYNDIHSFRKIFIRYTDLTPKEYRSRYRF